MLNNHSKQYTISKKKSIKIYININLIVIRLTKDWKFPQKPAALVEGRPNPCCFDFKWSEIKAREDWIPFCCYDFKLSDITTMGDGLLLASDSKQVTCGRNIGCPLLQVSNFLNIWKRLPKVSIRRGRPIFLPQVTYFESDANNNPSPIAVISLNLKS